MDVPIYDIAGKQVGARTLDSSVWEGRVNYAMLVQALAMYRTNLRAGTADTKTRADVRGGGKKPWKQKHTGRARAGSIRSPLWRHGGIIFGPQPRDMSYRLPQQMRRKALLESLKGKLRDAQLLLLEDLRAETPKTKPFGGLAKAFKVVRRSVIVLDAPGEPLVKSLRNLPAFELRQAASLNAYDVLNADKVLVTQGAFARLEARFGPAAPAQAPKSPAVPAAKPRAAKPAVTKRAPAARKR